MADEEFSFKKEFKKSAKALAIMLSAIIILLVILELISVTTNTSPTFNPETTLGKLALNITTYVKNVANNLTVKLFNIGIEEGFYKIIGKKTELGSLVSFIGNLILGLIAGLIVVVMSGIASFLKEWSTEEGFSSKVFITDLSYTFIGKAFTFAVIFAIAMQITFINQILNVIMLFWIIPLWLKPFVITVYFYYGPSLIRAYLKEKKDLRATEKVINVDAGMKKLEYLGKS